MWVMTPYGFFSIVRVKTKKGKPHPTDAVIRARSLSHLEALRERFPCLPVPVENVGTDYPCRIIAPYKDIIDMVTQMASCIDYVNFKDEAHRVRPKDSIFHSFLMSVWHMGLRLTRV